MNCDATAHNSQSVYNLLKDRFSLEQEELWLLGLNSQLQILICDMVFRGTANYCLFHPRDVFRRLLLCNATHFILCHNHPSGSPEPSPKDQVMTKNLLRASQLLQIEMLDHVVFGKNSYFSFADSRMLSGMRPRSQPRYRPLGKD